MQKIPLIPIGLLCFALFTCGGMAEPAKPPAKQGEQTRKWLNLQQNGQAASSHNQTLPGPVAAKIYERYLNSFSHPIPQYFSEIESNPFSNSR